MAVKFGFQLVVFLHLLRFGFVDSKNECVFNGNSLVPFNKDTTNGRRSCQYTLLGTENQDHIDSFRIDVICDKRTEEHSVVVTALKKKILLNISKVTVDQIPLKRDVSILIPPLRMDVTQNGGIKKVSLNTGISVLYVPPGKGKVIVFDNYTGTHNLSGACGNPWPAGRSNHDVNRHRFFKFVKDKPKYTTKYITPHSANVKPKFNAVTSANGHRKNRRSFLNQRNGAHNPQANPKNSHNDRNRFQDGNFYPNCYSGGFWRTNGSVWMAVDCSVVFTCRNSFVTHKKSQGCSEFAECVKVQHSGTCRCKPGFIGNGLICIFLQDKITSNHRPANKFAALRTPMSSAHRPIATVADNLKPNVKGSPTYFDGRNQGLMPSFNNPWGRQNRNNFIKKNDDNTWRPSKMRPYINTHKPRGGELKKQMRPGSFQLNAPPNFLNGRRNPNLDKLLDLAALVIGGRNRLLSKTEPNSRQQPRTEPSTMRSGQKPKIFGRPSNHVNKNNRDSKPGNNPSKDLIKPLKGDRTHFMDNLGHPGTPDKNAIPRNSTFRVYPISDPAHDKPRQRYILCRKDNFRMLCKLIKDTPKNDKMRPALDPSNPNQMFGKGRMTPLGNIPNNFIPYQTNKPREFPAASPNNGNNLLRKVIKDIFNPENDENPIKSPTPEFPLRKGTRKHSSNNEYPLSRTLKNPKQTNSRPNHPNLIDTQEQKPPYLNRRGYEQPAQSDLKRVTKILSEALNEPINKIDTTGEWTVVPVYSTRSARTNVRVNTFPTPTADLTSTVTRFIDSVSKKTGDGRFYYSSSIPSSIQHFGTIPTVYTSVKQPLSNANRPVLPNDNVNNPSKKGDNFIPNVKSNIRKKTPQDTSIRTHRYPTADGTIDGFLVDSPAKWPLDRPDIKETHGNYNNPTIKHFLHKYRNKESNKKQQNRPLKNRYKPTSKIDFLIKRCKLNGSGCMKIKNATGKSRTLMPRKNHDLLHPFTGSVSLRNNQGTTMLYSTRKIMSTTIEPNFTKDVDKENRKPQQPITNPKKKSKMPRKNIKVQPSSIVDQPVRNELKREKCDSATGENTATIGLRYKIMKKVKQSVEQIEG